MHTQINPSYYVYPGLRPLSMILSSGNTKLDIIYDAVMALCREKYQDPLDKLTDITHKHSHVTTRMMYYYFARKYCPDIPFRIIGQRFNQHYSIVLRSARIIADRLSVKQDEELYLFTEIQKKLQ